MIFHAQFDFERHFLEGKMGHLWHEMLVCVATLLPFVHPQKT
jgi:hypothetical protein